MEAAPHQARGGDEETMMGRSAQPSGETINTLATAFAETVAEAMEQARMELTFANIAALTSALNKALVRVGGERERAVRQSRLERRATWVAEQGMLNAGQSLAEGNSLSRAQPFRLIHQPLHSFIQAPCPDLLQQPA